MGEHHVTAWSGTSQPFRVSARTAHGLYHDVLIECRVIEDGVETLERTIGFGFKSLANAEVAARLIVRALDLRDDEAAPGSWSTTATLEEAVV